MATCHNCGRNLPLTGKVCPFCGAKRGFMNLGISWKSVLIVLVVLFIIGKCTGTDENKKSDKSSTTTEQFIDNHPSKAKKQKRKIGNKNKKRHNRQSIIFMGNRID